MTPSGPLTEPCINVRQGHAGLDDMLAPGQGQSGRVGVGGDGVGQKQSHLSRDGRREHPLRWRGRCIQEPPQPVLDPLIGQH